MATTVTITGASVAPMRQRQTMEFPYKHSTGETIGRFLAGLKEQKKIWGQRVAGQGVVVPPLGYSEIDGSPAGEWVEVKDTGVVTAAARVDHPIERLHPAATPFAFVLVRLDGADTAMAHVVKEDLDRVAVGARVQAVWAADDQRKGHIRDIECFRVIASAPERKPLPLPTLLLKRSAKKGTTTKRTKATKKAKTVKVKTAKARRKTKSAKAMKPRRGNKAAKAAARTKARRTQSKLVKPRKKTKPAARRGKKK
jgi:uncharacterized OB-fold protein